LSRTVSAYISAGAPSKHGSCHLFRHSAATLMLEGGADVRYVSEMLGHAKLETTALYTRVSISPSWTQVGFKNAGMRETMRALRFALGWGLATAELGQEPESVEHYATVMEIPRSSAYRDHQAFKKPSRM